MADRPMTFSIFSVQDHYPDQPRTAQQLYEQLLDEMVLADGLGYDTFWVAEHHFHEYGIVPNPAVFLAAAAQRTQRIRLGVAISVLPFRNPLLVAEDYAMVDLLSRGRLTLGIGSGYLQHEFEGFAIPLDEKRDRFDENQAILMAAFSGLPVRFQGRHNRIDGTAINITPLQKPHPPIYVAVLRKEAAYHVGRGGNRLLTMPYATVDDLSEMAGMVAEYERGWRQSAREGPPPDIGVGIHAYVAAGDADVRRDAEQPFDAYVASRLYGKSAGWDEIIARRYCIFGGVETAVARLEEMRDLGIRNVMLLCNFGNFPAAKVAASMRLIADQVIPRFEG